MLFFCEKEKNCEFFDKIRRKIPSIQVIRKKTNKKRKSVTLQVRIPCKGLLRSRKRVSFSASASMTVEAALTLPLFLFAGVLLMMPFRILDIERQVQAHLEAVGEDISQSAYFTMEPAVGKESLTAATAYGYAEAAVRIKLRELPIKNLSLASSQLLDDKETVYLVADYEVELPFSVFGLGSVKRKNICYRRGWIGESEKGGDEAGTGEEEQDMVYIGRNSTRYHESRTCHYLYNDLKAVSLEKITDCRNQSGGRYTPCSRCGGQAGLVVYIMPSGNHYHSSSSCSAIQAYVSQVPRVQAEHLGPCSYCSGKH